MITIDGSMGEGGGQVLRTSLGLSLLTGQPFRIENIRAGRDKPGLMRQHLTAVEAAARVSGARLHGDSIGSQSLEFEPGRVKAGRYEFTVSTAGSATLVLQTILPALITADDESELLLGGGTHNPWSPPFDFLAKSLLPLLAKMGPTVKAELLRPGFYPAGGGEFVVHVDPAERLLPLELVERGEIISRRARAMVARLSDNIAQRELDTIEKMLGWPSECLLLERKDDSRGPGNIVMVEVESRNVTEVFTAFGEMGVQAETVAARAVDEVREYLAAGVPVGRHLADQLLVPMAMVGGKFRTVPLTRHTTTNIEVIKRFIDIDIETQCVDEERHVWQIDVTRREG